MGGVEWLRPRSKTVCAGFVPWYNATVMSRAGGIEYRKVSFLAWGLFFLLLLFSANVGVRCKRRNKTSW